MKTSAQPATGIEGRASQGSNDPSINGNPAFLWVGLPPWDGNTAKQMLAVTPRQRVGISTSPEGERKKASPQKPNPHWRQR